MEDPTQQDGRAHPAPGESEVEAALTLAREQLEMDIAFLGEIGGGRETVRAVTGDAHSFGFGEGTSVDLSTTVCDQVLAGRVDGLVPDAVHDERVSSLETVSAARIGAYVGVPLSAADARLYMLCCLSHESRPTLDEGDLRFMRGLGETVLAALDRER